MKQKFIEKEICYTGKELAPHWIYKNHEIQGDAVVSFIGECDVKLSEMVDIADVLDDAPIYSRKMLHFIVEHFNMQLIEGVVRQRLLVSIARDVLLENGINPDMLLRQGDDLFYIPKQKGFSDLGKPKMIKENTTSENRNMNSLPTCHSKGKLSVSIAAKSMNSVLIHFAMNIDSEGTPVRAAGLKTDMGFENISQIAENIMNRYTCECEEIIIASCKVRGII